MLPQCTPVGESAAAVIAASEEGLARYGLGLDRAVRVAASAGRSQRVYDDPTRYDAMLTGETAAIALREAGVAARDLDVVELHDAFTVEEVEYVEAMGLCPVAASCLVLVQAMLLPEIGNAAGTKPAPARLI